MQLKCIALLVAATLLAVVHAAGEHKLASSDEGFKVNCVQDTMLLRPGRSDQAYAEERAVSIPGLSNLKNGLTTKSSKLELWLTNRKQLQAWTKQKNTPEDVFKLLKLDEGTETLMASPKLVLWMKYLKMYNKKYPDKARTMLGVFTKTYGDEAVAKMLEAARRSPDTTKLANSLQTFQLSAWAQNGLSPDVVFRVLKVGEGGVDKLMSNKALNVWFYYFNQMNRYSEGREVNLMKKLLSSYDDIQLAKAFEAAKHVKTTEFMGKELQNAQFRKWFTDGLDPPKISRG